VLLNTIQLVLGSFILFKSIKLNPLTANIFEAKQLAGVVVAMGPTPWNFLK
jgi:hypothetical protein